MAVEEIIGVGAPDEGFEVAGLGFFHGDAVDADEVFAEKVPAAESIDLFFCPWAGAFADVDGDKACITQGAVKLEFPEWFTGEGMQAFAVLDDSNEGLVSQIQAGSVVYDGCKAAEQILIESPPGAEGTRNLKDWPDAIAVVFVDVFSPFRVVFIDPVSQPGKTIEVQVVV